MTNLPGQCHQCGLRNAEGATKCARCDTSLIAGHAPEERRYGSAAVPLTIAAVAIVAVLLFAMTRKGSGPVLAAGSPAAFAAGAGEPPEEELVIGGASPGTLAQGPQTPSGQLPIVQGQWREVISLDGAGAKRSPTFSIVARHWRIRWTASPAQDSNGWIYSIVYRKTGKSLGMAINGKGESGGVARLQGRGKYYVEVQSNQNWTMNVEQWY